MFLPGFWSLETVWKRQAGKEMFWMWFLASRKTMSVNSFLFSSWNEREEEASKQLAWRLVLVGRWQGVIKMIWLEFIFRFTFFTTRTNFKPKQTQTNSFILVSSEAVTRSDIFARELCLAVFGWEKQPCQHEETTETRAKEQRHCTLLGVCVAWKKGKLWAVFSV